MDNRVAIALEMWKALPDSTPGPDAMRRAVLGADALLAELDRTAPKAESCGDPEPCCPTCGSFSNTELQRRAEAAEALRAELAVLKDRAGNVVKKHDNGFLGTPPHKSHAINHLRDCLTPAEAK